MNYRAAGKLLGNVLKYEAIFMCFPVILSIIYREQQAGIGFAISIAITFAVGLPLSFIKEKNSVFNVKDGLGSVAAAWFALSLFGAFPFFFSGNFNSFIDCFFESASGFSTTGATILNDVEALPKSVLFWRSFTHWIGGMGVIMFMLALMPTSASLINIMKAESPGPSPSKITPKIRDSAKILYIMYFSMTIAQIIALKIAGMNLFDSIIHSFATAGTGGFSSKNLSIGAYDSLPIEIITTISMILFGVNFGLYFFLITKKDIRTFFKDEELRFYLGVILVSIILISVNIFPMYGSVGESLRQSSFQVSSIITTTGYSTVDFNLWPAFSKMIIFFLMLFGGCAGSTSGGIKMIRFLVLFKVLKSELTKIIHPRIVDNVKINNKTLDKKLTFEISFYCFTYLILFISASLIVSLDNVSLSTIMSAVASTMGNIGPGLGAVGPSGNFGSFSPLSKATLSFCMIAGRLELFPVLVIFLPAMWRRKR